MLSEKDLFALKCKASFKFFVENLWHVVEPRPFVDAPYIDFLCQVLQDRVMNIGNDIESDNLLINISPATGKSTLANIMLPCFAWLHFPEMKILAMSASTSRAQDFANISRRLIASSIYQSIRPLKLMDDQNTKSKFENQYFGSRTSLGSEVSPISFHAQMILLDDIQTMAGMDSELDRNRINILATAQIGSRTGNAVGAQIISIQQRLGLNDLTSYLDQTGLYSKIVLSAELNNSTTNPELYIDGLLAPNLLTKKRIEHLKTEIGIETFECQYNQRPNVSQYSLIKREMFDLVDFIPLIKRGSLDIATADIEVPLHIFVDSAFTANTKNDPTAAIAVKLVAGTLYVQDIFQRWLEFNPLKEQLTAWIQGQAGYNSSTKVHIEPKASGHSLLQDLKQTSALNVFPIPTPTESKRERLRAVSARIENGRVKLLRAAWNKKAIDEFCGLTAHDDILDCLIYSIDKLIGAKNSDYTKMFRSLFQKPIEQTKAFQIWNT
jgi:predicted phage terminase large subunit-like protein